jgi:hypothetical protein
MLNRVCSVVVKLTVLSMLVVSVGAAGCGSTGGMPGTGGMTRANKPVGSWAEWPMPNSQADVTAGAPNPESYMDNGDGTVTDKVTGLMWQQAVAATSYTWADAVAYCPTLTLAGHSDWRLPSRIELLSLVDVGQFSPSINGTYFPSTPATPFWSSSRLAGSSSFAWGVLFGNGGAGYGVGVSDSHRVRCVR